MVIEKTPPPKEDLWTSFGEVWTLCLIIKIILIWIDEIHIWKK